MKVCDVKIEIVTFSKGSKIEVPRDVRDSKGP